MVQGEVIFHVDMDAFYTSIEQRDQPDLRGKPVIVGSKPGTRGVVSAASYEARKFGVHSAMPIGEAYRRCPQGVYLRPRMDHYLHVSGQVMDIFQAYSPQIEPLSVDEAFIQMTGTEKLWGPPLRAAQKLQLQVKNDLDLTCSIGIAPNKFLAKLASDINKPFGITQVPRDPEKIRAWLAPMNIRKIWGVGAVTQTHLKNLGIERVAQLQNTPLAMLKKRLGNQGEHLKNLSLGIDDRAFGEGPAAKSISREHTFATDNSQPDEWRRLLLTLARDVAERARKEDLAGKTVTLTWRTPDFKRHSRQMSLETPTHSAQTLYDSVLGLLKNVAGECPSLRLLGLSLSSFGKIHQTHFWESEELSKEKPERAMDRIQGKYGQDIIRYAGELGRHKKAPPE